MRSSAPMLMMLAGVFAARCRRANSRATKKVPLSVMSTTVRQAFGDMSSAGTGKLAAALLDAHLRGSEGCGSRVEHGGNRLRVTDVADDRFDRRPEFFDRGAARVEVLLFADWRSRCSPPRRANSWAIPLAQTGPSAGNEYGGTVEGARRQS